MAGDQELAQLPGVQDVDLKNGVLRVRMCLKALPGPDGYGKRVLVLADLKTRPKSPHDAAARDDAVVLRALKAQQAKDRLRLGEHYADSGLVLAAESGAPR